MSFHEVHTDITYYSSYYRYQANIYQSLVFCPPPTSVLATTSRFIIELIFKTLINTYIISKLHPIFWQAYFTSLILFCTQEGNALYRYKIFVLYLVKLSDSANLVILVLPIGNNNF